MGMLEVPNGSTNVIPGRCRFSLDIRATTDPVRDDCVADVLAELHAICERRGVYRPSPKSPSPGNRSDTASASPRAISSSTTITGATS